MRNWNPWGGYFCSQQQVIIPLGIQKIQKYKNIDKIYEKNVTSLLKRDSVFSEIKGQDPWVAKNITDRCRAPEPKKNVASTCGPDQLHILDHILVTPVPTVLGKWFDKKNIKDNDETERDIVEYAVGSSENQRETSSRNLKGTWQRPRPVLISSKTKTEETGRGSFKALKRNRRFLNKNL
jgi:hypothetical protein